MIFFLSSGTRPRYLDDIVRALALPEGAVLTFRYERKYVTADTMRLFDTGNPKGQEGVLCYIDQSATGVVPRVFPCRLAVIEAWEDHGRTISVDLRLGGLPSYDNVETLNEKVRESNSPFPDWKEGRLSGAWCLNGPALGFEVSEWSDIEMWHKIVDRLSACSEFDTKEVFLRVLGIRSPSGVFHQRIKVADQWYNLTPGSEYVVEVYHYHPTIVPSSKRLSLAVGDDSLLKIVSVSSRPVDSRYGLLRYRVISGVPIETQKTALIFKLDDEQKSEFEFDAPIAIKRSWWRVALRVCSIGIFVAAPGLVAASLADKLTGGAATIMVLFGICAGVASTLMLPRSA